MLGRIVAATLVICGAMTSSAALAQSDQVAGVVAGVYEFYPVSERYGVGEHHSPIVTNRAVMFDPQARRVIHVY